MSARCADNDEEWNLVYQPFPHSNAGLKDESSTHWAAPINRPYRDAELIPDFKTRTTITQGMISGKPDLSINNNKFMKSKQFLLVFRREYKNPKIHFSPEKLQMHLKKWQKWLTGLAVHDILASQIKRWDPEGRVLKKERTVSNGPYNEVKTYIDTLITIHAVDYEEAKEIAQGCPVFELGGTVEIRMAV